MCSHRSAHCQIAMWSIRTAAAAVCLLLLALAAAATPPAHAAAAAAANCSFDGYDFRCATR